MDVPVASYFADLVVGLVGAAFFRYGKKQGRPLQIVTGIAMMVVPVFTGAGALVVSAIGAALVAVTWLGVRAGF